MMAQIAPTITPTFVRADELTEGDIIRHFTGDTWLVTGEPEYTNQGIVFDVMWLDVDTDNNVQTVTFAPAWRFEIIDYRVPAEFLQAVA